jgi:predicted metal-dependent hydrolase
MKHKDFIVDIQGQQYNLRVSKRKNSKRITLRPNHRDRRFDISIPYVVAYSSAIDFFKRNGTWVEKHQIKTAQDPKFATLNELSLGGELFKINYIPALKQKIKLDSPGKKIDVFYLEQEKIEKQMVAFVKKQAKDYFHSLSLNKAENIGVKFAKVMVGDSKSKWGSCSSFGNLRYNFRLIMAPFFVIDYIVAHEVAHLKEFNHQPQFWKLVEKLTPYTEEAKKWLKQNGKELY